MTVAGIYTPSSGGPLRQGEILSDLAQIHIMLTADGAIPERDLAVVMKLHPLAIVLSQDCDLDWDFKARQDGVAEKTIPNVLFAEMVSAKQLRGSPNITTEVWKRVRQNKDDRYQFLELVPAADDREGAGLPELGIDFKRYFSVPTAEVYARAAGEARRRCRLVSPYLEHLSARFFNFQSRIGLPRDHESEPT